MKCPLRVRDSLIRSVLLATMFAPLSLRANAADAKPEPLLACLERVASVFQVRIVDASDRVATLNCRGALEKGSLERTLNRLLKPAGLDWQRLDDGTIQIVVAVTQKPASMHLAALDIDGEPLSEPQRTIGAAATPLAERALAVTRLDKDLIETAPLLSFSQIGQYAPNVYSSGPALSIRGIERDTDFFTSLHITLDGIDLGTRLLAHDLVPLDQVTQIDFARGPRAFEVGQGSEAGAIALVTAAPAVEPVMRTTVGIGTQGAWDTATSWSGPFGDSGIGGTIAIERRVLPDFIHEILVPQADAGKRQNNSARLKLDYESPAVPELSAQVSMLGLSGDSSNRWIVPKKNKGSTVIFDPSDRDSYDSSPWIAHTHARGEAGFLRYENSDELAIDVHGSANAIVRGSKQLPLGFPQVREQEDRRQFGLSMHKMFATDWKLLASIERADVRIRTTTMPLPADEPQTVTAIESGIQTTSASLWLEHSWSSEWTTGIGARLLREIASQDLFISTPLPSTPPTRLFTDNIPITEPLPLAVVEWHPANSQTISLSYGTAYRGGGSVGIGLDYGAEREKNLEVQWKAHWLNDEMTTSVALFEARIGNRYGYNIEMGNPNPGQLRLHGAEFEIDERLNPFLRVRVGLGLLHSRYNSIDYRFGETPSGAPKHTFNASLRLGAAQGWYTSMDAYSAGAAETDVDGNQSVSRTAYSLLGIRLGYRKDSWDISLLGANVLDEHYLDRADSSISVFGPGLRLGDPRRWQFTLSREWK